MPEDRGRGDQMTRTRVLHLSASFPRTVDDSVAPFLLDLVRLEQAAGFEVAVVAAHDEGLPRRQVLDGVAVRRARYGPGRCEVLAYRGGGHASLRSPWHAALLPPLAASMATSLVAEVRRFRPDVVHAHWLLPSGLLAALLPRSRRPTVVVHLHGNDVVLAAGRAGPLARLVARRVDAVGAVSEQLAREGERVLRLAPGTITVARLPLPAAPPPTPLPAAPLRALAAGRASKEKGFDVLLEAMALPAAAAWSLTMVTDGPQRGFLEAQAARLGLGGRVRFDPPCARHELHALVARHHAVVVPSRSEGLGLFALEALALGRPVVASRVGGLTEVVVDGDDGRLVPPDDPQALAEALGGLVVRPPVARAVERHREGPVLDAISRLYGLATAAIR
ncbi:MAG: glycosyltransferase [Acidimicrobiales bacterium]